MPDLTDRRERLGVTRLALLVLAIMLLPGTVAAAQDATEEPAPPPTDEPTVEPPAPEPRPLPVEEDLDAVVAPPSTPAADDAQGDDDAGTASDGEAPALPPEPAPAEVEAAEGEEAEEVAAPPGVPAQDDTALETPLPPAAPEVPPVVDLGVNRVPTFGTAVRPATGDAPLAGLRPYVESPQVAGVQVAPAPGAEDETDPAPTGKQVVTPPQPLLRAAAASLQIIRPSWPATALAFVLTLGAAAVRAAAVSRRRTRLLGLGRRPATGDGHAVRPPTLPAWAGLAVRPLDR